MTNFIKLFLWSLVSALNFTMTAQSVQATNLFEKTEEAPVVMQEPLRIIFQMSSADTLAHKALMRQLNNIRQVAPNTVLEVVCHGPGLEMLMSAKSVVAEKVAENSMSGVVFNGCEFTMKEKKVTKDQLILEAHTVPAGIIHVVTRQSQGWSYIKAGF